MMVRINLGESCRDGWFSWQVFEETHELTKEKIIYFYDKVVVFMDIYDQENCLKNCNPDKRTYPQSFLFQSLKISQ